VAAFYGFQALSCCESYAKNVAALAKKVFP
jgi:hypothetical protein